MNERVKKLWIDALRSGRFPQGDGQLCTNGAYCCLGVLEFLAAQEGVLPEFDGARPYLSPKAASWAGLPDTNPRIGKNYAGWMNDNLGYTFGEIANEIERYL